MARKTITVEGAKIGFRDFRGTPGPYNKNAQKGFAWFIEDEALAEELAADGFNVKRTKPRDDEERGVPYLNVAVRFDNFPPKVVLINGNAKTLLKDSTVGLLDSADIDNIDMVINASNYTIDGRTGIKAYLKTMYATISPDPFQEKYYGDAPSFAELGDDEELPF